MTITYEYLRYTVRIERLVIITYEYLRYTVRIERLVIITYEYLRYTVRIERLVASPSVAEESPKVPTFNLG